MNKLKTAYISLGSNQGDRRIFLDSAVRQIGGAGVSIIRKTSILENPALLYRDQPDFLNQILEIQTSLEPGDLLEKLQNIEKNLGRTRTFRYGPREIDLDILSYEDCCIKTENLTLPHPGLYDRQYIRLLLSEFSLTPEEIAPRYSFRMTAGFPARTLQFRKTLSYGKRNG